MQIVTRLDNFTVLAITEDEKLKKFTVGDRLGNRVTNRTFAVAADAMDWGYFSYVELVK